jgi:hypothetical protein
VRLQSMATPSNLAPHVIRAGGEHPKPDYKVGVHFFRDLGLIVKSQTGIVYTNRCAGYARACRDVEGFFVPLRPQSIRVTDMLRSLFNGSGFEDFKTSTADRLDTLLDRVGLDAMRADRSKLAESTEAWVHVIVSGGNDFFVPFDSRERHTVEGVFVWPNRA